MPANDTLSRRGFLKATGGVAGATMLAGCDGDGGTPTATEAPGTESPGDGTPTEQIDRGGTLNMINSSMTTLDPMAVGDTASGIVAAQCYEGLMTYPDGEAMAEQSLATGYDTNDDFTEYTFTIEEGVQFQNDMGELTASDFVYSWERLAASENSRRAYFILDNLAVAAEAQDGSEFEGTSEDSYAPGTMEVEATGDYELTLTQRRPFHATLGMLAYGNFAVVPEGIVGDIEGYEGEIDYEELATSSSYGTGPFQVDSWESGDSASVVAFDGFRVDDQPYLDEIHWAIIENPEPQYRYSTNRNADLLTIPTQYYDPDKVSVEEEGEGGRRFGTYGPLESGDASGETVNYYRVPTVTTYYIGFDVTNTEPAVREAVAHAVNREEIVNTVFKNRVPPGFHLTPPSLYPGGAEGYDAHVEENYPYGINETQLDQAAQVMEEAGYGPDNQYELTINSYQGIFSEMVRGLRDKLSSAHISASVEPTDFATIIQRGEQGNLQCYTLGWIADWPAADNFLQLIAPRFTNVAELGQGALTYTNWSGLDTEAKNQAEEAWSTVQDNLEPTDDAASARADAYVQMEEANWEDVVLINLVHNFEERFFWDGVHVDPFGGMGPSRQTHYTTWIEDQ